MPDVGGPRLRTEKHSCTEHRLLHIYRYEYFEGHNRVSSDGLLASPTTVQIE